MWCLRYYQVDLLEIDGSAAPTGSVTVLTVNRIRQFVFATAACAGLLTVGVAAALRLLAIHF